MFIGELSLMQWVSQALPYELSNVTDYSLLQLNNGIEDASMPPEDSTILNTCLIWDYFVQELHLTKGSQLVMWL
jgi:hypothetical protein